MVTNRIRVWVVASASFFFSACAALSGATMVGVIANYLGIIVGFSFCALYLFLNLHSVKVRLFDLVFLSLLVISTITSLMQSHHPIDILGNFIRGTFLILAVTFWRAHHIRFETIINDFYKAFWFVALFLVFFVIFASLTGFSSKSSVHVPICIFLYVVALCRGRMWHIPIIIIMIYIFNKEATFVSLAIVTSVYFLKQNKLAISIIFFGNFLLFALAPVNPLIYVLNALGGNFEKLAGVLDLALNGAIDESIVNAILSNRYVEYTSVFLEWERNGIPFFGYGLGATIEVKLPHLGDALVERSTIHNSFVVIFHAAGGFGILYLVYYVLTPMLHLTKQQLELSLIAIGYITYALFSNTLLQEPSMVFIFALIKKFAELNRPCYIK